MTSDEKILDHLESQIPEMAELAFNKAYWEALSSGQSVMIQDGNDLVLVHPDGSREFKKKAPPSVTLSSQHFTIK